MQIGILQLQNLVYPVNQLDIGIAPHLAEHVGRLNGLVAEGVELAEECGS